MTENNQKKMRKGVYLLPNLLTTSALFSGFYAIVMSMNGRYESAAIAIFVAMILDGLDGRVARMTNTQSDFGAEYDSLADMVSFGLAPSILMYAWVLSSMGKVGWLVAFVYTAAAALRLARFNTQVGVADKRFFQGLPSPTAAAILAGLVWVFEDYGLTATDVSWVIAGLALIIGVLMVSNVRYHSFKDLDLHGRVPFVMALVVVSVLVLVTVQPPVILFLGFLGYALSGPIYTLSALRGLRKQKG